MRFIHVTSWLLHSGQASSMSVTIVVYLLNGYLHVFAGVLHAEIYAPSTVGFELLQFVHIHTASPREESNPATPSGLSLFNSGTNFVVAGTAGLVFNRLDALMASLV